MLVLRNYPCSDDSKLHSQPSCHSSSTLTTLPSLAERSTAAQRAIVFILSLSVGSAENFSPPSACTSSRRIPARSKPGKPVSSTAGISRMVDRGVKLHLRMTGQPSDQPLRPLHLPVALKLRLRADRAHMIREAGAHTVFKLDGDKSKTQAPS